eukprot:CCRYP_015496-RA/>CCRYP_015496-RA protein AED:0.28 eAED:0.28 QI:0/-1/0/1/-1/1/1/0/652
MPLSMVKEPSQGSLDGDESERTPQSTSGGGGGGASVSTAGGMPRTLKRSPYLSEMTKTTDSDLMAMLSRPSGRPAAVASGGGRVVTAGEGGGGGGLNFLQLKRPGMDAGTMIMEASVPTTSRASATNLTARPLPSALRSNHQLRTAEPHPSQTHLTNPPEMKKSTSVTFSQNTKRGSRLGLVHAPSQQPQQPQSLGVMTSGGMANASAVPLGRERASSVTEEPSSSTEPQQQQQQQSQQEQEQPPPQGGKNQFPFYFDTLKEPHHVVSPSPSPPTQEFSSPDGPVPTLQDRAKIKAKSVNTLQYYYKAGMRGGISAQNVLGAEEKRIFSKSLRNLTFREMLDEGDGKEGDLNLRLRNEQWKVFRSSSCGTHDDDDHDDDDNEGDNALVFTPEHRSGSLLGSKRVLTPSSSTNSNDRMGDDTPEDNILHSSENNDGMEHTKAFPTMTMHHHPQSSGMAQPQSNNLVGSHRGCVSAYDLAVFRRAASRMKMSPQMPAATGGAHWIEPSQRLPGETLGAAMLSRLSSSGGSSNVVGGAFQSPVSTPSDQGSTSGPAVIHASPLAQMMANKFHTGMGASAGAGAPLPPMSLPPASSNPLRRRVHTVSAGLAYGSAGFRMDTKTRLSRFELAKDTSILSLSSQGSGQGGFGKNEEWS